MKEGKKWSGEPDTKGQCLKGKLRKRLEFSWRSGSVTLQETQTNFLGFSPLPHCGSQSWEVHQIIKEKSQLCLSQCGLEEQRQHAVSEDQDWIPDSDTL